MAFRSLLFVAAALSLPALSADWPGWRGPDRTAVVPAGIPVPASLPSELNPLWHIPIGGGFASPIVSNGRVFYLDNQVTDETIHAADAATGKEIWKATLFASHKDGFGIGPRCTPLADGKLLFVQSCKGEFQCLDAETGKLIWKKNFVTDFHAIYIGEKGKAAGASRHGASGAPLIDGEKIIVQAGGQEGASLVAFNKATGEVIWKAESDIPGYAGVMIATLAGVKQAISFSSIGVFGVDAESGKLLWRVPLITTFGRHVTTPMVSGDIVMVASHMVGLVATRITKGPDGMKAESAWTLPEMRINFASPVIVNGHLYGLGPAKNIVCIDTQDGKLCWEKMGAFQSPPDKAYAGFIAMGKNILMLNDSGQLILFASDPAAYKEAGRVQVCGNNWCNPAYADGKLYLRDAKELLCVKLVE